MKRILDFHLLDRRTGYRAVSRIEYEAASDSEIFGQVFWEWLDAGRFACCEHHRAHAMYGFANTGPEELEDALYEDTDEEIIFLEQIVDAGSGERWDCDSLPSGGRGEAASRDISITPSA